ncbi:Tim44/TimA family putative adaptor protein [Paracoccus sp. p4-l81]|uniref:Tim44/TimA family putative adaptor protein n=1 Tax=unclassified Paracoccus (in: a-proteobacteria) TaxID=2688777 RepID=UPI0035B83CF1
MSNPLIQILVLAAIAVFLILKLRNILGTREGFERPAEPPETVTALPTRDPRPEDHDDGIDHDIADHVEPDSPIGQAIAAMKQAEPGFSLSDFLQGARGAYEMILTSFDKGQIEEIRPFLAAPVAEAFDQVIAQRAERGLVVSTDFLGLREMTLAGASFDPSTREAEITVRFTAEMVTATRNAQGEVVDGDPKAARKQRDNWTFARTMTAADPNWELVATGG